MYTCTVLILQWFLKHAPADLAGTVGPVRPQCLPTV